MWKYSGCAGFEGRIDPVENFSESIIGRAIGEFSIN